MSFYKTGHVDNFTRENLPPRDQWPWLNQSFIDTNYTERLNASYELVDKTIAIVGPNKLAIIAADGNYTYGELLAKISQVANYLESLGVNQEIESCCVVQIVPHLLFYGWQFSE